jgi:hypothetical protein
MRKSLWIMLAVLFVAIGAPSAQADAIGLGDIPGGTVILGSGGKLTDGATLSGGMSPTGTITFVLYDPSNSVVDTETVPVNGDGTYSTLVGYGPTVAGTYFWSASYSGDSNNGGLQVSGTESVISTVPEPSTVALMLLGVGILFVMRKRISQGLPQAT